MKMLVVSKKTKFLEFIKYLPCDVTLLLISKQTNPIRQAIAKTTLIPRLKLLSWTHDIVFCDWFDEIASTVSKVSSKPIYIRLHRYEAHSPIHIKTANLQNIKGIITVSNHYRNIVRELVKDNIPVHVVPNAVDTKKFKYNPTIHNPLKLCTVSNLVPRKRLFDLIVNNTNLEIDVGGEGIEKRTLQDVIDRFESKAKLCGRVHLPQFYYQHDIFIMNSSDESFGVSLTEAMSCGLIPLCFAWSGIQEILPQEHIYHNYQELNEKLSKIQQMTTEEITEIKKRMRAIVESKFTLEQQASNFIHAFQQETN